MLLTLLLLLLRWLLLLLLLRRRSDAPVGWRLPHSMRLLPYEGTLAVSGGGERRLAVLAVVRR